MNIDDNSIFLRQLKEQQQSSNQELKISTMKTLSMNDIDNNSMMIMFDNHKDCKELLDQSNDNDLSKLNENLIPCSLCERKFLPDRL
ncbi:hypothetical protein BLA29_015077, partial [Euroglyphus maynei]